MAMLKKTVTIPEELYNEAREVSPNFSSVVYDALQSYLAHQRIEAATMSFGGWQDRGKSSVEIVNTLREEEARKNAKRSD